MKNQLSKKEQNEPVNTTIGRLRVAIQYGSKKRQLALLEKIAQDKNLRTQEALQDTPLDVFDIWKHI